MPIPAWVGPVAAGVAGFIGGERANQQNREEAARNREFQAGEARTNRAFQERMRNTEWQAAVEDMRLAGINPALAYSRGGASAMSGSTGGGSQAAPAHDTVSSAMQSMRLRKDMQLMEASLSKTKAEAETAEALATREKARNLGYGITERDGRMEVDYSMPGLVQETQANVRRAIAEAARTGSLAEITGLGGQFAEGFGSLMPGVNRVLGVAGRGADSIASTVEFLERLARMRDESVQRMFGMPKRSFEAVTRQLQRLQRRRN